MTETAPRRGSDTRERILDLAEAVVLQKGFGATSIDELVAGAGITKSGFFYHFKDKSDLAKTLLERCLERDHTILDDVFGRARQLHEVSLRSPRAACRTYSQGPSASDLVLNQRPEISA